VARTARPPLRDLSGCPHCDSPYVQATDWKALPDGRVSVAMRCPECLAWMSDTCSWERARRLDRDLADGRAELRSLYRRTVRHNMQQALDAFVRALELDLIGADDFRPRRQARCRSYHA
jgi:hypothetical protein